MKKRLLSMLVCAFILVPVFLTGCSDTDETLTVEQTKASAITLTLYSIVEDGTTETAVKAVQNALNDITENTLNTHVILKFYTASEYEKVLNDKINEIQADMDLQQRLKDAAEKRQGRQDILSHQKPRQLPRQGPEMKPGLPM